MTTAEDIKSQAQKRLKELEAQIKESEDAISGLKDEHQTLSAMLSAAPGTRRSPRAGTSRASASRPASSRNGSTSKRRRAGKRAPRGQRQQQLLEAAQKSPQARPADLAKAIGVSDSQVHSLISKSKKEKKLSRPGGKWKVAAS